MLTRSQGKTLLILLVLYCLAATSLLAKPYGEYDVRQIVKKNEATQQASLDLVYVDTILQDLRSKAESYPVRFDSEADLARARRDVSMLMGMLSIVGKERNAPLEVCLRLGMLGQIGHNLQLPGMAEAADYYFAKGLSQQPNHAPSNYHFGLFLAQSNRAAQSLRYLEAAKSSGYASALFTLGLVHLSLNDKEKALENLSAYQALFPSDVNTQQIIEAIKQGNVKIQRQ